MFIIPTNFPFREKFNFTAGILEGAKSGVLHLAHLLGISPAQLHSRVVALRARAADGDTRMSHNASSRRFSHLLEPDADTPGVDLKLADADIEFAIKVQCSDASVSCPCVPVRD